MISKRLSKIVDLVPGCRAVADIGTDHGYVPIALAKRGDVEHIIGMDIRKGPLAKADLNVRSEGLADRIELRLSDGADKLEAGEVDAIVISGMGGELMQSIISAKKDVFQTCQRLILSPQSELDEFRSFLIANGYHILMEDMIYEEGKYYFIMSVKYEPSVIQDYKDYELLYGRKLIEAKDAVLLQYLINEKSVLQELNQRLSAIAGASAESRYKENESKLKVIEEVLTLF